MPVELGIVLLAFDPAQIHHRRQPIHGGDHLVMLSRPAEVFLES